MNIKNIENQFKYKAYFNIDWYNVDLFLDQLYDLEFCKYFKDKLDWPLISKIGNLSEQLIILHKDRLDWNYISMDQKLSLEFLIKYHQLIDFDRMNMWNKKIDFNTKQKYLKFLQKNEYKRNRKIV